MELGLGLTKIIPMFVYLGGLVVIVLTLFYRIEVGLFFMIPLLTQQSLLEHMRRYPMGKDFMDLLFLVLLIKWMIDRPELVKNPKWRKPVTVIVYVSIVWTFTALWIGSLKLGFGNAITYGNPLFIHWKNFVMLPLLYLIVVNNVKDEKQIKIILILMTISMLYMDRSFYNNFQGKDTSQFHYDMRVGSTFSYLGPNELAVFYAQNTIILLIITFALTNKKLKWLFAITTAFNYYCLIFLYSRGGYLAGLMGWAFFGVMKDRRVLVVLALFLIFWRALLPGSVQQRIDMSETEQGTDSSIEERYVMWNEGMARFAQSPILGNGYRMTPYLRIFTGTKHRNSLHNGYLELLVEEGVLGLSIFLLFYFMGIRNGWRLYRVADDKFLKSYGLGFVGCVLAVLAGNIAGSYWFYFNVAGFFWVNMGLVVRGIELSEKSKSENKSEEIEQPTQPSKRMNQIKRSPASLKEPAKPEVNRFSVICENLFNGSLFRTGRLAIISFDKNYRNQIIAHLTNDKYSVKLIEKWHPEPLEIGRIITPKRRIVEILGLSAKTNFSGLLDKLSSTLLGVIVLIKNENASELTYLSYLISSIKKNFGVPYVIGVESSLSLNEVKRSLKATAPGKLMAIKSGDSDSMYELMKRLVPVKYIKAPVNHAS